MRLRRVHGRKFTSFSPLYPRRELNIGAVAYKAKNSSVYAILDRHFCLTSSSDVGLIAAVSSPVTESTLLRSSGLVLDPAKTAQLISEQSAEHLRLGRACDEYHPHGRMTWDPMGSYSYGFPHNNLSTLREGSTQTENDGRMPVRAPRRTRFGTKSNS